MSNNQGPELGLIWSRADPRLNTLLYPRLLRHSVLRRGSSNRSGGLRPQKSSICRGISSSHWTDGRFTVDLGINGSLIRLFVGLIAVLLKTGWAGASFVLELMMSLCDRAGCEGWGHWNRLRRAAVWVLVWLAAAVIRPLCLQQGPTELPWQGPMFPTPPDSPDGLSDTEGVKEGGRWKASSWKGRRRKRWWNSLCCFLFFKGVMDPKSLFFLGLSPLYLIQKHSRQSLTFAWIHLFWSPSCARTPASTGASAVLANALWPRHLWSSCAAQWDHPLSLHVGAWGSFSWL